MLDLNYIKDNTVFVIKYNYGRTTCKGNEVIKFADNDSIRDIDIASVEGQPDDLKDFYRAYNHAFYDMGRHDLFDIDTFYGEWSKDPDKFMPKYEERPVISSLHSELNKLSDNDDVLVLSHDGQVVGNHTVKAYKYALDNIGQDYDVVEVTESHGTKTIIVQDADTDNLWKESNETAWYCSMHSDEPYTPMSSGNIWVKPHFRKGRAVRGHYRKAKH